MGRQLPAKRCQAESGGPAQRHQCQHWPQHAERQKGRSSDMLHYEARYRRLWRGVGAQPQGALGRCGEGPKTPCRASGLVMSDHVLEQRSPTLGKGLELSITIKTDISQQVTKPFRVRQCHREEMEMRTFKVHSTKLWP